MKASLRIHEAVIRNPISFYRGCEGKQSHASRRVAKGVRRVMLEEAYAGIIPLGYRHMTEQEYLEYVIALEPYRCGMGHWHLGHGRGR